MDASDLFWSLPYIVLAAVLYGIYVWKCAKAWSLFGKARKAQQDGNYTEAVRLFKEALWKANEKPETEREILRELSSIYSSRGIACAFENYEAVMGHFEVLRHKGSEKALRELREVQKLKKDLIAQMPELS